MKEHELNGRLAQALLRAAPDDAQEVLSRCETKEERVISMREKSGGGGKRVLPGLIAACLALVLAGSGGIFYYQVRAVASVISLDVNPSIELRINRQEKVLSCTPLNDKAAQVLFEMDGGDDLVGARVGVAVNAVVGALVRHGYLDSLSSALLLSVEDSDQVRAARLEEELQNTVGGLLQQEAPNAALLSVNVPEDARLDALARMNNVSVGKAMLADQALELNSGLKFEALAALSVAELSQLVQTGAPGMPVGIEAAIRAAREYAGVLNADAVTAEVDPELDEAPAHYEVELYFAGEEFDYEVDAYSGTVLSGRPDILGGVPAPDLLTGEEAFNAAAAHLSALYPELDGYNILNISTLLSDKNGRQVYDVEFILGGYEFAYDIDALTGAVLEFDSDYLPPAPADPVPASITAGEAQSIALAHAGLTAAQVTGLYAKQDWDDGAPEYEIEFWQGSVEYEYTVRATDGAILKQERDDHGTPALPPAGTYISEDAARQAALENAGLSESDVTGLKIERDWDDGRLEYEIEFWCGTSEYDCTVDGHTGAVLKCGIDHHGSSHHSDSHHGGWDGWDD